jgi:hypothetical protein
MVVADVTPYPLASGFAVTEKGSNEITSSSLPASAAIEAVDERAVMEMSRRAKANKPGRRRGLGGGVLGFIVLGNSAFIAFLFRSSGWVHREMRQKEKFGCLSNGNEDAFIPWLRATHKPSLPDIIISINAVYTVLDDADVPALGEQTRRRCRPRHLRRGQVKAEPVFSSKITKKMSSYIK